MTSKGTEVGNSPLGSRTPELPGRLSRIPCHLAQFALPSSQRTTTLASSVTKVSEALSTLLADLRLQATKHHMNSSWQQQILPDRAEQHALQFFKARFAVPPYPEARPDIYTPDGSPVSGPPVDLTTFSSFVSVARGASHLTRDEPGQDRALTLDTPSLRIAAVSDGISAVEHSERAAAVLVHIAALSAEEVAQEAVTANRSIATREFGAALNARIARKLAEAINELGCDLHRGAAIFGPATLNLQIMTAHETTHWSIADGFTVVGADSKKNSDVIGRTRIDNLLLEVEDGQITKPLARYASCIETMLTIMAQSEDITRVIQPGPSRLVQTFCTPAGELLRQQLRGTHTIDPKVENGADAYLASVFDATYQCASDREREDLNNRMGAGLATDLERRKAAAILRMTDDILHAESAAGLQLVRNEPTSKVIGTSHAAVSSDGQRFLDTTTQEPERALTRTKDGLVLRAVWLTQQSPAVVEEVVELWNRICLNYFPDPHRESEKRALAETAAQFSAKTDDLPPHAEFAIEDCESLTKKKLDDTPLRDSLTNILANCAPDARDGETLQSDIEQYERFKTAFVAQFEAECKSQIERVEREQQLAQSVDPTSSHEAAFKRLSDLGITLPESVPLRKVGDDVGIAGVRQQA